MAWTASWPIAATSPPATSGAWARLPGRGCFAFIGRPRARRWGRRPVLRPRWRVLWLTLPWVTPDPENERAGRFRRQPRRGFDFQPQLHAAFGGGSGWSSAGPLAVPCGVRTIDLPPGTPAIAAVAGGAGLRRHGLGGLGGRMVAGARPAMYTSILAIETKVRRPALTAVILPAPNKL
jgi:hypothetical protein